MNPVVQILFIFILFAGIDLPVYTMLTKKYYQGMYNRINQDQTVPKTRAYVSAILVYLLLATGLYIFVIRPEILSGKTLFVGGVFSSSTFFSILLKGMFYGLLTYGASDLINLATLSQFGVRETMIDLTWAVSFCGILSVICFYFLSR
jgi:uncharacterized membrane protein